MGRRTAIGLTWNCGQTQEGRDHHDTNHDETISRRVTAMCELANQMSKENGSGQGQKERVGRRVQKVKESKEKKFRRFGRGLKYLVLQKIDVSSFFMLLDTVQLPRTSLEVVKCVSMWQPDIHK